jgi:hypothetical protein
MITKSKQVMCDSCQKEIKQEPKIVFTNGKGWGAGRVKENHFHPTPLDCAYATEPVKIYMARAMTNERRTTNG